MEKSKKLLGRFCRGYGIVENYKKRLEYLLEKIAG